MEFRIFYIEKKSGKKRKIVAPKKELKNKLRTLLITKVNPLLNKYINIDDDDNLSTVFHGFIDKRSAVTAAAMHCDADTTISMDISNHFDSITKSKISVLEPELHTLIFNSGITQVEYQLMFVNGSLPQGFPTSPAMANLYMISPMLSILKEMEDIEKDDYRIDKIITTLYADDITISIKYKIEPNTIVEERELKNKIVEKVKNVLMTYGVEINKKKTHMSHERFGFRRILGVMVSKKGIKPTIKTKMKMRAAVHQGNLNSMHGLSEWAQLKYSNHDGAIKGVPVINSAKRYIDEYIKFCERSQSEK